jgi:hypothetical protein
MLQHSKLPLVPTVLVVLAVSLAACSSGVPGTGTISQPGSNAPPGDSNPVFLATPKPSEPTPPPADPDETGAPPVEHELYFIVNDFSSGRLSLAKLPYACIVEGTPCPAEIIPSYPNVNESIRPLVWSPDGKFALLPFLDGLHRFDPAAEEWLAISHVPLSEQPEWSPNGEWVAFVGMSGGIQSIHIVRPDGSEPKNLTAIQFASPDDHLTTLFWLDDETLAFWYMAPGKSKGLLQVSLKSGEISPLIQMSGITKDILAYSPDRQQVALETFQNGETRFAIANADGSSFEIRSSYGQASIWPMAWSPDGQWVAFSVYRSPDVDPLSHVYLANRESQGEVRELFSAAQVPALVWAPDSQHLIIQAEQDGPSRLFVANIDSGEVWPVVIEGLGEGAHLSGASWR